MAGVVDLRACGCRRSWSLGGSKGAGGPLGVPRRIAVGVPGRLEFERCSNGRLFMNESRCIFRAPIQRLYPRMALVEEKPILKADAGAPIGTLAYDLVQGALVGKNSMYKYDQPTAVLLHGILGCRKNWGSFARRLAQEFPTWQFLLVDLRCHGESACIKKYDLHSVASAALDVLKLVGRLRLTPRVLVGHSFGGKVALSMVEQAAKPLARPVKVWVLDATPGIVRPGGHGEDRPAELISFLRKMPDQFSSKREVIEALLGEGFSNDIAQWVATNLRQSTHFGSLSSRFSWVFDLNSIQSPQFQNMAFILLFPLLLSLTSSAVTAAVLDTNGQPLRPGVGYYILPVIRGRGGGLATAPLGNNTCPLYVAQERLEVSNGLPVKLYPVNARAPFVELSADANFVFSGATICVQSMVWQSDSVGGTRFVGISGTKGNPGGSTIGSWFKVEKYGRSDYKLVFCPAVCNFCRPACGDLGVVVNGGRRYLVVGRGSAFPVMFKKA